VFRTSSDKKDEKERVRAALLRAALRLGAAHGFASLGLREVAREAGIAPTSFYRHFADMQELGLALSRELVGEVVSSVADTARASDEPVAAAMWDALLQACAADPELLRFFVAERVGASPSLRASLQGQLVKLAQELANAAASEPLPPSAANAAVVMLLDACTRALEEPDESSSALRESWLWIMGRLLAAPSRARPQHPAQKSSR